MVTTHIIESRAMLVFRLGGTEGRMYVRNAITLVRLSAEVLCAHAAVCRPWRLAVFQRFSCGLCALSRKCKMTVLQLASCLAVPQGEAPACCVTVPLPGSCKVHYND